MIVLNEREDTVKLTSYGFTRYPQGDFEDDGNRFKAYTLNSPIGSEASKLSQTELAKEYGEFSYLRDDTDIYLCHHVPNDDAKRAEFDKKFDSLVKPNDYSYDLNGENVSKVLEKLPDYVKLYKKILYGTDVDDVQVETEDKDVKRAIDLKNDIKKARKMAYLITNKEKLLRRIKAILDIYGEKSPLLEPFLTRASEMGIKDEDIYGGIFYSKERLNKIIRTEGHIIAKNIRKLNEDLDNMSKVEIELVISKSNLYRAYSNDKFERRMYHIQSSYLNKAPEQIGSSKSKTGEVTHSDVKTSFTYIDTTNFEELCDEANVQFTSYFDKANVTREEHDENENYENGVEHLTPDPGKSKKVIELKTERNYSFLIQGKKEDIERLIDSNIDDKDAWQETITNILQGLKNPNAVNLDESHVKVNGNELF